MKFGLNHAANGLLLAFRSERNLKIQLVCALTIILLSFICNISLVEWLVILLCIGAVISLELINTSIEKLVNLVEPNYNPLAGQIKDISAGAVLFASIISIACGTIIFGWRLCQFLVLPS